MATKRVARVPALLGKPKEGFVFSRSKPFENAYLATDYVVQIDGKDLVLRPNERSPAVDRVLSRFKVRGVAFVTAFNPYSRMRGKCANLAAHAALVASLRREGKRFVEGYGQDHDKLWPAEKSVLIFGVIRAAAGAMGRQFGQNAIVFAMFHRPIDLVHLA
jgi:hypothetical protein